MDTRRAVAVPLISLLAPLLADPCEAQLTAGFPEREWVAAGASWRFRRGVAEPSGGALDWAQRGFDDGSWTAGAAGFGYGDGDDRTVLSDMQGAYSSVYIRKVFEVDDPSGAGDLVLLIDYDDGFIAFLNGREIARANAGPAGSYPGFDGLADRTHEAGTEDSFRAGDAASLLVPGSNVLAVVGFNADLDSGDFSLHPRLRSRTALAPGCPDEFFVASSSAVLAGAAPIPASTEVLVDGEPADFDPGTGAWSRRISIAAGSTLVTIEARGAGGALVASRTLRITRARALGGTIDSDLALSGFEGPYVVVGRVVVPPGRRLTIGAGCELLIAPGAGFEIGGEIQARGAPAQPIRFTRLPCGANWGSFTFEGASGENLFRFCEWSFATGSPGCLTLNDSNLELDGCTIRDIDGEGVHSTGGRSRIRRCLTERTREALSLDTGDTVVEFCTVRDAIGDSDLIDANGSTDPPARIAFNVIYGTTDDGIDADGGSVIAEGNVIHDCADQAISLVGSGSSIVRGNLCFRNGNGLSVKDSHVVFAERNTFVLNGITGVRAIERTSGRGGGIITLESSIVWANGADLLVESGGSIAASFCDVGGPPVPGPGNLSLDPLFAAPDSDDFRLTEGSPCIGAGPDGQDLGALPFETLPLPPADLGATVLELATVSLTWRDGSSVEDGFEVERAAGDGSFLFLTTAPANATRLFDEGLSSGIAYRYRVRARNDLGVSPWVGPVEVLLTVPPPEIAGIEPPEGPSTGGTLVTIRGRGFVGGVTAYLGGSRVSSLVVASTEEIRGVAPPGARGPADLVVATSEGEATRAGAFTYYDLHLRGDATADGRLDVSDAISTLRFLFTSGSPPPCLDVADLNRDAMIDISDPVYLLLHLFAGNPAPDPAEARCAGDDLQEGPG